MYLIEVDVELGQSVQDELSLIDEDVWLVPEEFLAVLLHVFGHGGTEHHHLLVMWGFHEDVLDISPHLRVSHDLVTFIDHKELDLIEIDQLVFGQIVEPSRSGNDDVGVFGGILDLILIFLEGDASEVAAVPQFWFFEVSSWVRGELPSLLKSL